VDRDYDGDPEPASDLDRNGSCGLGMGMDHIGLVVSGHRVEHRSSRRGLHARATSTTTRKPRRASAAADA
jgi:hypothetical protein